MTRKLAVLLLFSIGSGGCRQDMHDQPKDEPLERSAFFADQRSSRPLVPGTVARGPDQLRADEHYYTGKTGGKDADTFPFRITAADLARGQERFNIYCSPCHGRTGYGDGMIVQRGYRKPASFHDAHMREHPVGHFFDVVSNGFGAMPDYAAQIPVRDRWTIIAYVKALQLSQHAVMATLSDEDRAKLPPPGTPPDVRQAPAAPGVQKKQ